MDHAWRGGGGGVAIIRIMCTFNIISIFSIICSFSIISIIRVW